MFRKTQMYQEDINHMWLSKITSYKFSFIQEYYMIDTDEEKISVLPVQAVPR